jgi:hypothetical protein
VQPTPPSRPAPYIERFGFAPKTVFVVLASAVFCALSFLPGISLALRVVTLVFCGGIGLFILVTAVSRGIALRIDQQGVTLGAPPMPWLRRQRAVLVPWRDLQQVMLFSQVVPSPPTFRMPYIGLALRPGAPPPPGARLRGRLLRLSSSLVPHIPPEVIPLSRQISGWRLDRARLLAAVAAYAPDVGVVEVEQDGSTHPVGASPQRRPWGPVAPP